MNRVLHRKKTFGASGHKWADHVRDMKGSILDYGCGKGTLKKALGWEISEYDPCIPGKDTPPEPHDCVVCTDVLEHIEPEHLDAVLSDLKRLMRRSGFLVIATRPAKKTLPDGRNAHLIVKPPEWWRHKLEEVFTVKAFEENVSQDGECIAVVE